jgi:GNAT superfamily N-acetyltransferase
VVEKALPEIRIARSHEEIARCFPVMHQLRPKLTAGEFVECVGVQQKEGYEIAYVEHDGAVVCVAGFRLMHVFWSGKTLYVDDLVTDEAQRSHGFGEAMVKWLIARAREEGCETFSLDSGTQRKDAHAFYMRLGLRITDFHFQLPLVD